MEDDGRLIHPSIDNMTIHPMHFAEIVEHIFRPPATPPPLHNQELLLRFLAWACAPDDETAQRSVLNAFLARYAFESEDSPDTKDLFFRVVNRQQLLADTMGMQENFDIFHYVEPQHLLVAEAVQLPLQCINLDLPGDQKLSLPVINKVWKSMFASYATRNHSERQFAEIWRRFHSSATVLYLWRSGFLASELQLGAKYSVSAASIDGFCLSPTRLQDLVAHLKWGCDILAHLSKVHSLHCPALPTWPSGIPSRPFMLPSASPLLRQQVSIAYRDQRKLQKNKEKQRTARK